MKTATTHSGMIVDVIGGRIFPGMIYVESGKINAVRDFVPKKLMSNIFFQAWSMHMFMLKVQC
ncbi:MAG: hypothetical protein R6T91_03560 [Bacteroidales bacterium]